MLLDRDLTRLEHIATAIDNILEELANKSIEDIDADRVLQSFLAYQLQIIGEAASRLTRDFRKAHPDVPWEVMKNMRNRIVHEYSRINIRLAYGTVRENLPALREKIRSLLEPISE